MTTTIGYVGLDHHHCEPYLRTLERLPVDVTCACEPGQEFDVESVGLDPDLPLYRSTEDLLENEDVDVVWVTRSNEHTPAIITTAVEHGVDVYTEKPAARTAADLDPVIDTVDQSDATVCLSYTWRGHPIASELRERAIDGFFGSVRSLDARFIASSLSCRDTSHYLFDAAASRGGILQWLGIHWIDLLPWMLDDPIVRVSATTERGAADVDIEDGAIVMLETASGAIGTLQTGYYLREGRYDTRVGIYGTAGTAEWDPIGRTFGFDGETTLDLEQVRGAWSTPRRQIVHEYDSADGYGGQWGMNYMKQFLDARTGEASVPADIRDAQTVLRVLDAAYESAETGSWVDVERSASVDESKERVEQ